MTIIKTKDVLSNLLKKGFQKSENDQTYLILFVNGKKTSVRTKISLGAKEINDSLINLMSIQLKIEKKFFIELVTCIKNGAEYIDELEKKGFKIEQ